MKKILMFLQCALLSLLVVSCDKEPYAAADIEFDPVYRVVGREYNVTTGIQVQTYAQKKVLTLDPIYDLYIYYDRSKITTFSNKNYVECKIEDIYNFKNDGVEGEYYHVTFSRMVLDADGNEVEIFYEIMYYVDRSLHERLLLDDAGNPVGDENGDMIYEKYYLDNYVVVTTADGTVIGGNDNIDLLEEKRAF